LNNIIKEYALPIQVFDTIIIGSGSAAYNAADWLYDLGRKNIAIITEGIKIGTSRNTGSDKQTYYKMTLAGEQLDSVYDMAKDLFNGGSVDGDNAYVEAAGSVKAFMKLAMLGVPFPANEYGEYVGYQTDHDIRGRATSAGPLTSKYITECLEQSVQKKQINIFIKRRYLYK
jgi:succinate dehydrogenase/fumarate reductase flavoprotein subunit